MFVCFIIAIKIICVVAQAYNEFRFVQPERNSSQHIWHSYSFNTGAGNREELYLSNVERNRDFESINKIFTWKSVQIQDQVAIVGLCNDLVTLTTLCGENNSSVFNEEFQGTAKALSILQKWDAKTQKIETFIVVAIHINLKNYILKWYRIFNKRLEFLWDWPFYGIIVHLDVIKIKHESKLLIISHKDNISNKSEAEIYSFNILHYLDIWLFEKISLEAIPSSVAVFDHNDNIFLCASFPSTEMLHIFKYSQPLCLDNLEKKKFFLHQKIFSTELKSVISFQVSFQWYLAVASRTSLVYYIGDSLFFQPISTIKLGSFNNWLAIPVDTYREDTILLADSNLGLSVLTWTDKNLQVLENFSEFVCGDDFHCLEKMKKVALNKSTAFEWNGHQNVLLSLKNGSPLFFKLLTKLKPLPDKVTMKMMDVLHKKNYLEENYNQQNKQINELLIKKDEMAQSTDFLAVTFEASRVAEGISQTKNQSRIITDINQLKATVESLNHDIRELLEDMKSFTSLEAEQDSNALLKKNVTDGITFYDDILISELYLSTLNGYDVNELLKDFFRKNNPNKIGGKKTLKNLNADNVIFEKMGDTLACELVFSDDPWEEKNENNINGDIIWEKKLNILNDVTVFHKASNWSISFDTLNLENLEVTEDILIQRTINGQPLILPAHVGHLNILDIVNQPRIEVVNVKENLDVDFINGKNFSRLFEHLFKPHTQYEFEILKVDGLFSAAILQTYQINSVDLSKLNPEFTDHKFSEDIFANNPDFYAAEGKFKRAENDLKRTVHVFQNLEVNGILFSNKINNISWVMFNDTVKKNENPVTVTGTKKFEKLISKNTNLTGTLNKRYPKYLLRNFSNQSVRFSQVFESVIFKNVSLKSTWDGVLINLLNKSLVKLSSNNGQTSDLIFENECFMDVLNVTNMINDISLKEANPQGKSLQNKMNLKFVKADYVILQGSLITNNNINKKNLTNFALSRVSLKSSEIVKHDLFHNNITLSGDLNLNTLNSNNISNIINAEGDTNLIEKFLNGEIRKIKKLLVKGNIITSHGINGFNVSRINEKGICITKPNSVKGNITFENTMNFDNINITSSIDGFSLKKLEKDIAFKYSQVFLSGVKNFSTIRVMKSMRARTLNTHLVQELVTLEGDQTMKGPVLINGDVIVKGNTTTYAAINNISVPDLLRIFSTRFNSLIRSGDLNLQSDRITIWNLIVGGSIQNVLLSDLVEDAVSKKESFNFSGKKYFEGEVHFKKNVLAEGFVHGVNFSKFFYDIIFTNKPARPRGTVIINESVLKVLKTARHFNSTLINNVDTNDWLEDSIPLDSYELINGKKSFEDVHTLQDVSVTFINGHLPSAMISLKKKQYIPSLSLFPRIHTTADVSVEGYVNGKNLINEFQDTILVYGAQAINGETLFDCEFVINGALFVNTIKGKPIANLMTLDTEQIIKTALEFKGSVMAKKDVESLKVINNIRLEKWNQDSVLLNRNQVLNGFWTVKGRVKTKNIDGEGLVRNVSLLKVFKDSQRSRLKALGLKNATAVEYSDQCHKIEQFTQQFSKLPYLLNQFEIADEIETSSVIDSVITFKINDANHLIVTFLNECLSTLYKWNKNNGAFDYMRRVNIGLVNKWSAIYHNEATYLITSSLKNNKSCEKNLQQGNVWVFKGNSDKYTHLISTDAFVDITHEKETSKEFFTIHENGVLMQWTLEENDNISSRFLLNIGPGNHKFIDFRIMGGLAISNGRELKQVTLTDDEVIENNISFTNANLVALPVEGKILIAFVIKDKIVIYENILEDKIFSVIHTYRAGSVLWFSYGSEKQAFLIVASHHKFIEVYEYKSVSGLVKKMTLQMFSSRLQSETLPVKNKYQYDKFLVIIQKKKLIFVRAEMLGDFVTNNSFC